MSRMEDGSDRPTVAPSAGSTPNQLDFYQAMRDFKVMFPLLSEDIIETVLRANSGAVDATIDQLLSMSTEPTVEMNNSATLAAQPPVEMPPGPPAYDSISSAASLPPPAYRSSPAAPPSYTDCTGAAAAAAADDDDDDDDDEQTLVKTPFMSNCAAVLDPHAPLRPALNSLADEATALHPVKLFRKWTPALLGKLPVDFLRLQPANVPSREISEPLSCSILQQKMAENERRRSHIASDQSDPDLLRLLEDEKLALMLQNAEFLDELQLNAEFMDSLHTDHLNSTASKHHDEADLDVRRPNRDQFSGYGDDTGHTLEAFPFDRTATSGGHDHFRQQLRNMGGMSRRKFLDAAKHFFMRKKKRPSKSMLPGYDWQRERDGYSPLDESKVASYDHFDTASYPSDRPDRLQNT